MNYSLVGIQLFEDGSRILLNRALSNVVDGVSYFSYACGLHKPGSVVQWYTTLACNNAEAVLDAIGNWTQQGLI